MKKIFGFLLLITLFLTFSGEAMALNRDSAINALKAEYEAMGDSRATDRAEREIDALIRSMENSQYDVETAVYNLSSQVNALARNSSRRDPALDALESAENKADDFTNMRAEYHIRVQASIAGALPYAAPEDIFIRAQDDANAAIAKVRQILIAPDRPGTVPTGDVVEDFIPQIIRQLFRFAWLAVLISLIVSGVMFVMAHDNEEKLTKAKAILFLSLVGFAFISLAFAVVKAVTDIDFFRFI